MSQRIAVLGLGAMGLRAATRLAGTASTVCGYDPAPAARDRATESGLRVHDSPESAIRDAEVIVLSLPGPAEVTAVAAGPLTTARDGAVVADLSTIDPQTARTASTVLADSGVTYIDAPVLGRPDSCGSWTLVAGGPAGSVDRLRHVLEGTIANRVVWVGDTGAGNVVKLVNNLMFGAINAITAEAVNTCRLAGVDPGDFVSAVAGSGAATVSALFRDIAPRMLEERYGEPAFTVGLLHKDNRLALELAHRVRAPVSLAETIDRLNTEAVEAGLAQLDTASVYQLYQRRSGETHAR